MNKKDIININCPNEEFNIPCSDIKKEHSIIITYYANSTEIKLSDCSSESHITLTDESFNLLKKYLTSKQ